MPAKKKKYNARFPALRIKKIMQSDEEIGKVAQAVPIIISRTLELFVHALLKKTEKITFKRNAKTLAPNHIKQCIEQEPNFDFLRDLVKNIPDHGLDEGEPSHLDQAATSTVPADSSTRSLLRSHSLGAAVLNTPVEPIIASPNLINFYGSNVESDHFEQRPPKSAIQRNYSMPAQSTSTITSSNAVDEFPFKIEIKVPDDNGSATDLSNYSFPIASNSASFKIDFSNFNQLPGNSPKNQMDEDYDNI